jgi:hypothetical protein
MRWIVAVLILLSLVIASSISAAERQESAETFLSDGHGHWVSGRIKGNAILFIFKGDGYCGGNSGDILTRTCGTYQVFKDDEGYYLKLMDKDGKVMRMRLEIKNHYTIILNGVEMQRKKP